MAELEDLVKTTLGELREVAKAQSVVGDPVEVGKTTVIPLVKLGFGFAVAAHRAKMVYGAEAAAAAVYSR